MPDIHEVQNDDLVLRVSAAFDPSEFDPNKYDAFLDVLCGTREYQKIAIRTAVRYLLAGQYANVKALAHENYEANSLLEDVYGSATHLERLLPFPDQLSGVLDLATGTGKSFVLYGIAAILLAEDVIDQALVLCPSLTIEAGLAEKFRALAGDAALREVLPESATIRSPRIISGNESLVSGTICIENYHSVLPNSQSSIRPTLEGKGSRTLVLNDEAHHLYSGLSEAKKWAEFVGDPGYSFKYVIGVSGTCYKGDSYFPDVIFRYSLRDAIEAGFVKSIEYVAEDSAGDRDEKFQKMYDNHIFNKTQAYRKVKPLTILVTRDVNACKQLTEDLIAFLVEREDLPKDEIEKKVLAVTSDASHRRNVAQLPLVDRSDNAVEWITSVSMLTEGWDVQNVFQIVPHEERAFSSKLLIAQVLGRGLRVPDAYRGERPTVIIFNHDAWSHRIKHLVEEILEIETRLTSEIVSKSRDYNFVLHRINYTKTAHAEQQQAADNFEFNKGYVVLASQTASLERETTYTRALTGSQRQKRTLISYKMHSIDEVAEHIHRKFKSIDLEEDTTYSTTYSMDWLRKLIKSSLKRVGETADQVSEENRQRLQAAFGVVHRKSNQTVRYAQLADVVETFSTSERKRDSIGVSALRRDGSVFIDAESQSLSDEMTAASLADVIADESLPRSAVNQVSNVFDFRTPLNIVIANHAPERSFVRKLVQPENAKCIDGWIKATDQDFYSIEYSWKKGDQFKRSTFNPDYFISAAGTIYVVEIKGDEELDGASFENQGKYRAATEHFALLNEREETEGVRYSFHFLSPKDYDAFFQFMREGKADYVSSLDAALATSNALV